MKLSLVTPVRNGARFLPELLDSIEGLRGPAIEYIVVDGKSTDGTIELLSARRHLVTRMVSEADSGMYDALARGMQMTSGNILGWINSDDLLMPWMARCVCAYFEAFPECEWLTGVPAMFDEAGSMVWTAAVAPHYRRRWIARGWYSAWGLGAIQQECTFFRRSLYERVGGIDRSFKLAGDFDLWRRFAGSAELHQLGTVVAGFRLHGGNLSADLEAYLREAKAPRILMGTFFGSLYSFLRTCWLRQRRVRRFKDVALPGATGTLRK